MSLTIFILYYYIINNNRGTDRERFGTLRRSPYVRTSLCGIWTGGSFI